MRITEEDEKYTLNKFYNDLGVIGRVYYVLITILTILIVINIIN